MCNGWGLSDPDSYSLQFSESNNQNYITEKNRNEVKNGSILRLEFSPSKTASDILAKLNNGSVEEKTAALQKLSTLSTDMTFALEFINKQGLALIISQVYNKFLIQFNWVPSYFILYIAFYDRWKVKSTREMCLRIHFNRS